jgi:polyisoprenoid-binding protein YceI
MKQIKLAGALAIILAASAFTMIKPVSWKVKDDYSVKFTAGIQGYFKGLKAYIVFNEEDPSRSKITASINATTLDAGNSLATEHAKEALSIDKYPVIMFQSTSIVKTSNGYEATGNLTLKGITKEVKIRFIFDSQNVSKTFPFVEKETFGGSFSIASKDFNITRAGTPERISIELNIPVTK